MKMTSYGLHVALAACGALLLGAPAFASSTDEVLVQSSRPEGPYHRPFTPDQVLSITRHVSYADLDLTSHAGALELESRIDSTAQSICQKLDRLDRPSPSAEGACVRDAVRDAMMQAHVAIAAAKLVAAHGGTFR